MSHRVEPGPASLDYQGGEVFGGIAQRLLKNNMNPRCLRTNATLKYDEWKDIDREVVKIATQRMVGIADLRSRGLVRNINGMAATVTQYQDESDMTDANISMSVTAIGDMDRLEYETRLLPLPIIHKSFMLDAREIEMGRKLGEPLETSHAGTASRKCMELAEQILFMGSGSLTAGGGTLYGYTDFPYRTTGSLTGDWSTAGVDGQEIESDVLAMIQDALDARHWGPFVLYVPAKYETKLNKQYNVNYPGTIRAQLLSLERLQDIKVADFLTGDNVVLVEMQSETVRLVNGQDPMPVEWNEQGGLLLKFKVILIHVVQLRRDQAGRSGIVHYSA